MEAILEFLSIAILYSTCKNTLSFLLCLSLLFNKIRDKGRTGSAWKRAGEGGEVGSGGQGKKVGAGLRGRKDPSNVCTCE
jgi:hypothetical protein